MFSSRTSLRKAAGLGIVGVALSVALITAPSSVARGSGCANANADIGSISKSDARAAIICLFNDARGPSVSQNGDLQGAAQKHTNTMRSKDCFAHECPGEASFEKRIKSTGYYDGAGSAGEVIAVGPDDRSATQYVNKWLNSSDHRAQITKSAYRDAGVGINIRGGIVLLTGVLGRS